MSVLLTSVLIGAGLAASAVVIIKNLKNKCGSEAEFVPESIERKATLSETDMEYAERTHDLIKEQFGEDVVEWMKHASNKERIRMTQEFAERLAEEYGLDITVDVNAASPENAGYFDYDNNEAIFNIGLLTYKGNDMEVLTFCVNSTFKAIIHELRHAVQIKAIKEEGFWNVDEKTRMEWAQNWYEYISPEDDLRGYMTQPIEADADVFAELAYYGRDSFTVIE